MRKARLLCLIDKYEYDLISSTGKSKEDYIGQVGDIVHVHKTLTGNGSATNLFDKKWFRQTKIDVQKQIESEFEKTKNELLKEFEYLKDEREENNGEAC